MIRFAHPYLGLLFLPWLILLIWGLVRYTRYQRTLGDMGSVHVRHFLLARIRLNRQFTKHILFFLALGFCLLAATGPKVGTRVVELERQGVDVLLLLDTSVSMDATDVRPNRMEKAKYEMSRLIDGLKGDRIGMIVFAGSAHLHFPLTSDYAAAKLFLNAVDTRLVEVQGTVIADALDLAIETFDPTSEKFKTVVVVSDGEDHDGRALELAHEAAETGIVIHSVGVGSVAGAPVPMPGGNEFKKDRQGRIVTSLLNELMLEELAQAGGGTYSRVDNRSEGLGALLDAILSMEKRTLKTQAFAAFEDRYQLFLIPALILLLIEMTLAGGHRRQVTGRSRYA